MTIAPLPVAVLATLGTCEPVAVKPAVVPQQLNQRVVLPYPEYLFAEFEIKKAPPV